MIHLELTNNYALFKKQIAMLHYLHKHNMYEKHNSYLQTTVLLTVVDILAGSAWSLCVTR